MKFEVEKVKGKITRKLNNSFNVKEIMLGPQQAKTTYDDIM